MPPDSQQAGNLLRAVFMHVKSFFLFCWLSDVVEPQVANVKFNIYDIHLVVKRIFNDALRAIFRIVWCAQNVS